MEEFNSMPITRIYNTELQQGTNELNNIRQAINGSWGKRNDGTLYTGNIISKLTTSGNTISNTGSSSRCIVIVLFVDDTYTITALDKDESRTFDKEIKMSLLFGNQ